MATIIKIEPATTEPLQKERGISSAGLVLYPATLNKSIENTTIVIKKPSTTINDNVFKKEPSFLGMYSKIKSTTRWESFKDTTPAPKKTIHISENLANSSLQISGLSSTYRVNTPATVTKIITRNKIVHNVSTRLYSVFI